MGQLEPCAGKDPGEILGIFVEALRNHAVSRVHLHGHVGVGHHGLQANGRVFHIDWHVFWLDVDGLPLVSASRALGQRPFVIEQQMEVAVVPLRGVGGPSAFDAAGDSVTAHTAGAVVHPTQALFVHIGALRGWTQVLRLAVAMCFTHGVAACGQGHGFFVVHGHACKGQAHVLRRFQGIRLAVDAFGVHIDQTHLHRSQRVLKGLTVTAVVTGRTQPFFFCAPINVLLGVPNVFAAKGEAVGLEAHRFISHVASEHDQIGPADAVAVFLLDGPEQATRLVEVGIVGPRIERRKTLVASARAASAIGNAVSARGMPGHADHQTPVMSPIGRPPVLAVGHECGQVFLERGHIQLFDFFAVIEICPHGVGFGVMLVQDVQVQCFWPPSHSGVGRAGVGVGTVHDGALARAGGGGVHGVSFVVGISRFGVCKHGLVATAAERKIFHIRRLSVRMPWRLNRSIFLSSR